MKIGVLSLQGGVVEHLHHITSLGANAIQVKYTEDLNSLDGIILPGGESTTMGKLLRKQNLLEPLKEKIKNGLPVWGTCAGMILLSKNIENDDTRHLQLMDITVRRNAYGTQINSFVTNEIIEDVSSNPIPLVFIRAPFIVNTAANVDILHTTNNNIVAVKQDNMIATSFHPELTKNLEFHRYFISVCSKTNS